MLTAITRQVSSSIGDCELTFLERQPIDIPRARRQHLQYTAALHGLGIAVLSLPEMPDLPDAVFVEDTALVLDECAVLTRPGAESRRPEVDSIADALTPYRHLLRVQAPGRVDGGDILPVGRRIYVGLTRRSDTNAMEQLQTLLQPYGYELRAVLVTGCLHLKSAATQVAEDTLLVNPEWIDTRAFSGVKFIEVDASEPYAANAVWVNGSIVYPASFPKTRQRLQAAGITVLTVDADELAKAEGALTCCALIFRT
jgi:dimethylargininase